MSTTNFTITRDDLTEIVVDVLPKAETQGCYQLSIQGEHQGEVCFHKDDKYQWEFIGDHFSYREKAQIVTHVQQLI